MIGLGDKVKDLITGLEGIATAQCIYLNGCIQFEVTSTKLQDGKPISAWIDQQFLKVIKSGGDPISINIFKKKEDRPHGGGLRSHPLSYGSAES